MCPICVITVIKYLLLRDGGGGGGLNKVFPWQGALPFSGECYHVTTSFVPRQAAEERAWYNNMYTHFFYVNDDDDNIGSGMTEREYNNTQCTSVDTYMHNFLSSEYLAMPAS